MRGVDYLNVNRVPNNIGVNSFEELNKLIRIANKEYDGHFTLMKFTTDWGCCFGTLLEPLVCSHKMAHGHTMNIAIEKCIESKCNASDIYDYYVKNGAIVNDM